jgi:tRNA(Ile)-lysidine synthase
MLQKIKGTIKQLGIKDDDTLLVAVSGGLDSMVLFHLLREMGFSMAVAHCNFGLRDTESDLDELLVRSEAERLGLACHVLRCADSTSILETGKSVQMWAREIRYGFFNELMDKHAYRLTAMAHHADDRIESLLINLLRGTGIRGMQGMPVRSERFIRPMLSVRKAEIASFARDHGILFRDDSSNFAPKYLRNKVRLHLLPMLRQLNPDTDVVLQRFSEHVANLLPDLESWSERMRSQLVLPGEECLLISRAALSGISAPFTALQDILQPLGFSSAQTLQLIGSRLPEKGKMQSNSHVIYIEKEVVRIVSKDLVACQPSMSFTILERKATDSLDAGSNAIVVDADMLKTEDLQIRMWRKGDRFRPLGLKGSKKLSDFMIDKGFTRYQKDRTWLLVSGEDIVWVIGSRMDDRFKVTESTRRVLVATTCKSAGGQ